MERQIHGNRQHARQDNAGERAGRTPTEETYGKTKIGLLFEKTKTEK